MEADFERLEEKVDQGRIVDLFLQLVRINGPSKHEKEIAEKVVQILKGMGYCPVCDSAHRCFGGETGNIILRLDGDSNRPAALFAAHLDTVSPTEGIGLVVDEGIVRTDGRTILGADDRAGVAVLLEYLRLMRELDLPHGDIVVVFTVAEEIGMFGTKHLQQNLKADYGFVLDSGGDVGTIVVQTPSHYEFKMRIEGRAAHAGVEPEKGINAIKLAAEMINKFPLGRVNERTSVNIGTINGGTGVNIVPEVVYVTGEIRSMDETELEEIKTAIEKTSREIARQGAGRCHTRFNRSFAGFNFDPHVPVVKQVMRAARMIGVEPRTVGRGGGSDANVFWQKGIPSVNLGIGINNDHSNTESVSIQNLVNAVRLLIALTIQLR